MWGISSSSSSTSNSTISSSTSRGRSQWAGRPPSPAVRAPLQPSRLLPALSHQPPPQPQAPVSSMTPWPATPGRRSGFNSTGGRWPALWLARGRRLSSSPLPLPTPQPLLPLQLPHHHQQQPHPQCPTLPACGAGEGLKPCPLRPPQPLRSCTHRMPTPPQPLTAPLPVQPPRPPLQPPPLQQLQLQLQRRSPHPPSSPPAPCPP